MTREARFTVLFLGGPAIVFGIYALATDASIDRAAAGLVLCLAWAVAWGARLLSPGAPQPRRKRTPE
ncbi:MAG: hypothetical protein HYS45_00675 [Parcubacteria group bacterium]|nr:hypothetical protein [Parcubacteria group bacterium]